MASEWNGTTATDADLGRIRHGTSSKKGFIKVYRGLQQEEKPPVNRMLRRWEALEIPAWIGSWSRWWSTQREHDDDYLALPTASTTSFGEIRGSWKGGLGSLGMPMAAEDCTHTKSSPTVPISISPLLVILAFFIISTGTVLSALWTLPAGDHPSASAFALPKTVADVSSLAWALKGYSETSFTGLLHVLAVLSLMSVWANAWSIPGSVVLNILTGALLPPFFATFLQTILTTIGSIIATIIAAPLTPLITRFFPSIKTLTRVALTPSSSKPSSPWARLAILRLSGIVPWSSINIFSGLARPRISLLQCSIGAFIGVLPWTAVTCQIGDILSSLDVSPHTYVNSDDALSSATAMATQTISSILTSREALLKLVLLTLLSLAPVLAKDKLQAWLNGGVHDRELPVVHHGRKHDGIVVVELEAANERKMNHGLPVDWWRRHVGFGRGNGGEEVDDETLVALSMVKETDMS